MSSSDAARGLVVFESHHIAFRAEAVLQAAQVDFAFKIVLAPRNVNQGCDYAIAFPSENLQQVRTMLAVAGLSEGLAYYIGLWQ
ncbi:MAG: hypothetical protein DDT37_01386 [Firmicutes bacterium]|nr:hypothetical protein [candidate division NPL-UPA2 bacterium]